MDHDGSYKALFTHPALMADLLTGFFQQPWVAQCDFASLEKRNSSFVGDNLKQRSTDLVWRIRCGEEYLYVYLLLEFQSTVGVPPSSYRTSHSLHIGMARPHLVGTLA